MKTALARERQGCFAARNIQHFKESNFDVGFGKPRGAAGS